MVSTSTIRLNHGRMPRFGPISRQDLIKYLRGLGFEGPSQGGNHEQMVRGGLRVPVPNPHAGDISRALVGEILRKAGISREEWEKL